MTEPSATYDRIAQLPLRVEQVKLDNLELDTSSGFLRRSTVIRLQGDRVEGLGEDVTYTAELHPPFQARGAELPLVGEWTIESFSRHLEGLELFQPPPEQEVYVLYRRWGLESAALDLALRQAGRSLADVLGRRPRPVRFVISLRLGEPPTLEPIQRRLAIHPDLRFKLDATSDWTPELIADLRATGAVDSIDVKGAYVGTVVDQGADPELYRRVAEAFPEAWLEDPRLTPETDQVLLPYRDRVTWDAVVHSVDDVRRLPFPPRMVNVKPSRFGSLRDLLACYDHLERQDIGAYGGGQFELGPGRGQIQALAALFHPDAPNDIAPGGYNLPDPPEGLPGSPLEPRLLDAGFGWAG
ncbi:MAG: hypothetical protein ACXVY5_07875 [Gaiellales bacterium]